MDLRRVAGKQGILFRLAGAALEQPEETVRRAIYPVVGEGTLRDLVREAMANETAMKRGSGRCSAPRARTTIGGCCRSSWRH